MALTNNVMTKCDGKDCEELVLIPKKEFDWQIKYYCKKCHAKINEDNKKPKKDGEQNG